MGSSKSKEDTQKRELSEVTIYRQANLLSKSLVVFFIKEEINTILNNTNYTRQAVIDFYENNFVVSWLFYYMTFYLIQLVL